MNFSESKAYLLSLGNEVSTMKLGLENIRKLLAGLGDPQNNYRKVQVAGTNGKGSVCAFLNSICLAARIKTGMYTSPHLVSITERIKIDGKAISEEDFAMLTTRVRETSERLAAVGDIDNIPPFFEQVTAIALLAFAEAKVDLAILETGLGGRLDATTAANAEIAAITRIDLDHQQYLGETIEEIASEKAAILHEGSKAIILHQSHAAEQVIAGRAREVGIDPMWATTNILVKKDRDALPALIATFTTERGKYSPVLLANMLGEHQIENAAIAIGIAEILRDFGFSLASDAIAIGLKTASHPGRLEFDGQFLFDGAHNLGGAKALRSFLDDFVDKTITMIFGSMRDKDVGRIIDILFSRAETIILTKPSNERAMDVEELLALVPRELRNRVLTSASVEHALETARRRSPGDSIILITGSLYLVGEAKASLTLSKRNV